MDESVPFGQRLAETQAQHVPPSQPEEKHFDCDETFIQEAVSLLSEPQIKADDPKLEQVLQRLISQVVTVPLILPILEELNQTALTKLMTTATSLFTEQPAKNVNALVWIQAAREQNPFVSSGENDLIPTMVQERSQVHSELLKLNGKIQLLLNLRQPGQVPT